NSPRLSALLTNGLEANRSIYNPQSGGNTTCFSAGLAPALVAAVLPGSRSVRVGVPATAFATIINAGVSTATGVGISVNSSIPALFTYQTTDPATNTTNGAPNIPVSIAPGQFQTFVIGITPTGPFAPTDVALSF